MAKELTLTNVQDDIRRLVKSKRNPVLKFFLFYNSRIEKLRKKEFELIDQFLIYSDPDYASLCKSNLDLLKGNKFVLNTKTTANGFMATYSSKFEGRLFSNGHVYCRRISSWNFGPLSPSQYLGGFDHFGNMKMSAGSGLVMFSLAKRFEGEIVDDGKFTVSLTKREVAPNSGTLIISFIGDPFAGDNRKRAQFLQNRNKLYNRVEKMKVTG